MMISTLITLGALLLIAIICIVRRSRRPPEQGTPYHNMLLIQGAAAIIERCGPDEPSPPAQREIA